MNITPYISEVKKYCMFLKEIAQQLSRIYNYNKKSFL